MTEVAKLVVDGVSGWRLPHAAGSSDQPVPGVGYVTTVAGFTTDGEVGSLYTAVKAQYGSIDTSPLWSYDNSSLWTDGVDKDLPSNVALYNFATGMQGFAWNYSENHFTAVLSGNPFRVGGTVPEIPTWAMMLAGWAGLYAVGRAARQRRASISIAE